MPSDTRASYDIAVQSDTHIILIDRDDGASITNDAEAVIAALEQRLSGGIGYRRVYYLDTTRRFDELKVRNGQFAGFASCTNSQQERLAKQIGERKA